MAASPNFNMGFRKDLRARGNSNRPPPTNSEEGRPRNSTRDVRGPLARPLAWGSSTVEHNADQGGRPNPSLGLIARPSTQGNRVSGTSTTDGKTVVLLGFIQPLGDRQGSFGGFLLLEYQWLLVLEATNVPLWIVVGFFASSSAAAR